MFSFQLSSSRCSIYFSLLTSFIIFYTITFSVYYFQEWYSYLSSIQFCYYSTHLFNYLWRLIVQLSLKDYKILTFCKVNYEFNVTILKSHLAICWCTFVLCTDFYCMWRSWLFYSGSLNIRCEMAGSILHRKCH